MRFVAFLFMILLLQCTSLNILRVLLKPLDVKEHHREPIPSPLHPAKKCTNSSIQSFKGSRIVIYKLYSRTQCKFQISATLES